MTRNEFIAAWTGASPNARLQNFTVSDQELSVVDDFLQAIAIIDDAGESSVSRPSTFQFVVASAFFQDTDPGNALAAGEIIVSALMVTAMEKYYKKQKERQKYEKDYRKEQDKKLTRWPKKANPKAVKQVMAIIFTANT